MLAKRLRSASLFAALTTIVLTLVPAGAALANHGARALNLNPETPTVAVRNNHQLSATLEDAAKNPSPADADVTVLFEVDGPGDPKSDGKSFDSPDFQCVIHAGDSSCRKSYGNATDSEGRDLVYGWISDSVLDETEGQDAGTDAGTQLERDATDVVSVTWIGGLSASASLDCNPEASSAGAGLGKTLTCTVRDGGALLNGWAVDAENLTPGVNDPDDSAGETPADYDSANSGCVTGSAGAGQCRLTVPSESPAALGTAQICLWVDEESDASYHPQVNVEQDGALCDQEPAGAQENDNKTDIVSVTWKLRRAVSLTASRKVVPRGGSVTLRGAVTRTTSATVEASASTCVAGQSVLIKRDVFGDGSSAFVDLKTVKTGPAGGYTTSVVLYKGARYRAVVVTTAKCFGDTSPITTVKVG